MCLFSLQLRVFHLSADVAHVCHPLPPKPCPCSASETGSAFATQSLNPKYCKKKINTVNPITITLTHRKIISTQVRLLFDLLRQDQDDCPYESCVTPKQNITQTVDDLVTRVKFHMRFSNLITREQCKVTLTEQQLSESCSNEDHLCRTYKNGY